MRFSIYTNAYNGNYVEYSTKSDQKVTVNYVMPRS